MYRSMYIVSIRKEINFKNKKQVKCLIPTNTCPLDSSIEIKLIK